jgi:hypothetical protein
MTVCPLLRARGSNRDGAIAVMRPPSTLGWVSQALRTYYTVDVSQSAAIHGGFDCCPNRLVAPGIIPLERCTCTELPMYCAVVNRWSGGRFACSLLSMCDVDRINFRHPRSFVLTIVCVTHDTNIHGKSVKSTEPFGTWIEHATLKKVVIRYQMDGAGPHRDGTLLQWLADEFDKRGWVLVFQPANSPLTNVKDMSLFPALSKRVTALQGKSKRSLVLEGEELFQLATKAWEELPLSVIARSYAGHHQIVNAIAQCKGGDEFVREKGGIHCGIRQAFVPYYAGPDGSEPTGVELVTMEEDEIDEVLTNSGLKYPTPDVSELDDKYNQFLSAAELKMLERHLPSNSDAMECTRQALLINEWSGEPDEREVAA